MSAHNHAKPPAQRIECRSSTSVFDWDFWINERSEQFPLTYRDDKVKIKYLEDLSRGLGSKSRVEVRRVRYQKIPYN